MAEFGGVEPKAGPWGHSTSLSLLLAFKLLDASVQFGLVLTLSEQLSKLGKFDQM